MPLTQSSIPEKTLLFVTSCLLNGRDDCTESKKYRDVFSDLKSYLEILAKVYGIELEPLTNEQSSIGFRQRLYHVLVAGIPLLVPNGVVHHIDKMINRSVPIIVVADEKVPCDFVVIENEDKNRISLSCVKRDILKYTAKSNNENWNNSVKCFKDNDNVFKFGETNKLCDNPDALKSFKNYNLLQDLVDTLVLEFKEIRSNELTHIPILRFSTFLDIILWFHFIGKNILSKGLNKALEKNTNETLLLVHKFQRPT